MCMQRIRAPYQNWKLCVKRKQAQGSGQIVQMRVMMVVRFRFSLNEFVWGIFENCSYVGFPLILLLENNSTGTIHLVFCEPIIAMRVRFYAIEKMNNLLLLLSGTNRI